MFSSWLKTWRGEATTRALDLATDQTLRLPHGRGGTVVRVERGLLLVTREGDPEDHLLGPGMELRLPASGRSVGWALAASRVQLRDGQPAEGAGQVGQPARAGAGC